MAVIAPQGVVGRVVVPSARAAKVQLLIDRNAAAGALIERSRAQGIVMGSGDTGLRLEYVSEVADVVVGDLVVTSGIDGIFPKGFTIGSVTAVDKTGGAYRQITVRACRRLLDARRSAGSPDADAGAGRGAGDRSVKIAGVVAATALALALQTTLARFLVRGTAGIDLVLVVVVYAALSFGPVTGLLTGTFAGLLQDALGGPIIGIGGLAKTVVGFVAGVIGTQFIVAQSVTRFVVFFAASVLHGTLFIGLYELLDLRDFGAPYAAVAAQAVGNAVFGVVAFKVAEFLPGAVERRRAGRTGGRLRR